MAAGFNVLDALNKNSKAGKDGSPKGRFRVKDVPIDAIYKNALNFYRVNQIEELAGDILLYGLKQNLEVIYAPCEQGEYRLVAGERRWEALKYLVQQGYEEFKIATCKLTDPKSEEEEQVEIIVANEYRTKTAAELLMEEKHLKESLVRMKKSGQTIKGYDLQSGRIRDVIAKMLKTSRTKVAQLDLINKRLILGWKKELKVDNIPFSTAYELSGMSEEDWGKCQNLTQTKRLRFRDAVGCEKRLRSGSGKKTRTGSRRRPGSRKSNKQGSGWKPRWGSRQNQNTRHHTRKESRLFAIPVQSMKPAT